MTCRAHRSACPDRRRGNRFARRVQHSPRALERAVWVVTTGRISSNSTASGNVASIRVLRVCAGGLSRESGAIAIAHSDAGIGREGRRSAERSAGARDRSWNCGWPSIRRPGQSVPPATLACLRTIRRPAGASKVELRAHPAVLRPSRSRSAVAPARARSAASSAGGTMPARRRRLRGGRCGPRVRSALRSRAQRVGSSLGAAGRPRGFASSALAVRDALCCRALAALAAAVPPLVRLNCETTPSMTVKRAALTASCSGEPCARRVAAFWGVLINAAFQDGPWGGIETVSPRARGRSGRPAIRADLPSPSTCATLYHKILIFDRPAKGAAVAPSLSARAPQGILRTRGYGQGVALEACNPASRPHASRRCRERLQAQPPGRSGRSSRRAWQPRPPSRRTRQCP